MAFYSEEEQLGELRHLAAKYWKIIAIAILILGAVALGVHFWSSQQRSSEIQSATLYQELTKEIENNNATGIQSAQLYIKQHKDIYSVLLSMQLAKYYVEQKQYNDAEEILKTGIAQSQYDDLSNIMQLRLARLMLQQNQLSESLVTLSAIKNSNFAPIVNEIRGDIYMAQHQYQAAINAYQLVLSSDISQLGNLSKDINLKINQANYLLQTGKTEASKDNSISSKTLTSAKDAENNIVKTSSATNNNNETTQQPSAATKK